MITPAYAPTATELPIPQLSLDFTTASLDSRVTVARALDTSTRVNSSGLIETVNANLPRFDFDPIAQSCRGLLVEEARAQTSRITENIGNWSKSSALSLLDVEVSPDGTQTADRVYPSSSGSDRQVYLISTGVPTSGTVAISVFAKPAGKDWLCIYNFDTVTPVGWFNVATGAVGTAAAGWTLSTRPYKYGFYRCIAVGAALAGQYVTFTITDGDNTKAVTASGTNGLYLWGSQVEAGAFATSYIRNTGSGTSITRNADVVTMTGANFSGWWQAGKGSALVKARTGIVSGTRPWTQFDDATANNIISLRGNTTNPELYIRSGGADQAQIDAGTIVADTSYRLSGAWATDDCAASINSGSPVLDGVATIPTVTQARLGSDGTNYLNGHLEAIEYYDGRVLNASLQVVSSTAGYRSIIGPVFRDTIIS